MQLRIMPPGTTIQTLTTDRASELCTCSEAQPRRHLRCHAPQHIDLALAQSQVSMRRDFQGRAVMNTVWEQIHVADLPTSGNNKLTRKSYSKTQRAMAMLMQTRVENNESYPCEEDDLPEASDYISHHNFSDAYRWMLWEREAQRNFAAVREYLDEHPKKKEELWKTTHIAKRYWKKHANDFTRYFPSTPAVKMRTPSYSSSQIISIRTAESSRISGESALLTDSTIVSVKLGELAVETDQHSSESSLMAPLDHTGY